MVLEELKLKWFKPSQLAQARETHCEKVQVNSPMGDDYLYDIEINCPSINAIYNGKRISTDNVRENAAEPSRVQRQSLNSALEVHPLGSSALVGGIFPYTVGTNALSVIDGIDGSTILNIM